jgi:hypothetical protein
LGASLLAEMTRDEIVGWISCSSKAKVDDGIALHVAAIDPSELGWSYDDEGADSR